MPVLNLYLQVLLGLVCEGEGLGPKRVEGRVMEKVNPFMDKAEELRSRNFPEGALQGSRAKKLFKNLLAMMLFGLSLSISLQHQMILMKLVT